MYIGVDFGTSFSQAAVFYNNNPLPLVSAGVYGVPSLFYYDSEVKELTGEYAHDASQGAYAKNLVRDVKMRLNESFILDGKAFMPKDIIKAIYKEVIEQGQIAGEQSISDFKIDGIVISHPAKFSMQEISILTNAAKNCISGQPLNVLGTIKEPVAAALSYYHDNPQPDGTNILVYDLGGGTCDLAIVTADKREAAQFKVLDSDMIKIGGRNWDELLIDYAINKINAQARRDLDIRNNEEYLDEVRKRAQAAKITLSKREDATMRINIGYERYDVKITRDQFEALTVELLENTIDKLEEIYRRNPDIMGSVKEIICVGGSSNMKQVKNGIEARFPNCTVKIYKPEYAVCTGASIYASKMISILDFVPFSYGIRGKTAAFSNDYAVKNIITKCERYPVSHESRGFIIPKGSKEVKIAVYESESTEGVYSCNSRENETLIGHIILKLSREAVSDERITCVLTINSLDTIELEAHDERGAYVTAKFSLNKINA